MNESGEMYLKEIYFLGKNSNQLKSVDIAKKRKFSKPSVSRALHNLQEKGYILMDGSGNITFTDNGFDYTKKLVDKYEIIYTFLKKSLNVPDCIAKRNACKMEHDLSTACIMAMKEKVWSKVEC